MFVYTYTQKLIQPPFYKALGDRCISVFVYGRLHRISKFASEFCFGTDVRRITKFAVDEYFKGNDLNKNV